MKDPQVGLILGAIFIVMGFIILSISLNESFTQNIFLELLNSKANIVLVSLIILALGVGIVAKIIRVRM